MKKRNGFTLIELLAVIVILAIIALIATPMVLKYIESSKEGSIKNSSENIKKAALNYVAAKQLTESIVYPVIIDVQDLDVKNKESYTGKIIVTSDENVEEYIETNDYVIRNDQIINKTKTPYLTAKEGKTAVIDEKNGYVYSFYSEDMDNREGYAELNLGDYITSENGTVEFIPNEQEVYSTGAKIVLKDKKGNTIKEYTVIIFGDINGEGWIDADDANMIELYLYDANENPLNKYQLFASDVNRDGQVTEEDAQIVELHAAWRCFYNNITCECTPYERS